MIRTCQRQRATAGSGVFQRMLRRGPNKGGDAGHVMVLLIGYVLLALLLVTVVAAAGSIYLGHKKLLSMADGAALAAADTFELNGGSADSDPGTLLTDQEFSPRPRATSQASKLRRGWAALPLARPPEPGTAGQRKWA